MFMHSLEGALDVEILFFSRNEDYTVSNKIAFDKFIDPIIHLIKGKYSFLKFGSKYKFDKIRHQKTIFLSNSGFFSEKSRILHTQNEIT